jgi:hypothetical protein
MDPKYARIIDFLYGPPLRLIGFIYRTYSANRARLARFRTKQGVARLVQVLTVAIFVLWILVWIFAPDEYRTRLTDEVRQSIGAFKGGAQEAVEKAVD